MMQGQKLLMLLWHWFSEWGREPVIFPFACKCSVYLIYKCLHLIAPQITIDATQKTVDAPWSLLFRMGQWVGLSSLGLHRQTIHQKWQWRTKVNIVRLKVEYLIVTIKRKTRKSKPEIGTNRSNQTRQHPWVEGYRCLSRHEAGGPAVGRV